MSSNISVSKGVFVFKNGFSSTKNRSKLKRRDENIFSNHLWYRVFYTQWRDIETKLHIINTEKFSSTLEGLIKFVHTNCDQKTDDIPTVVLLTGVNMPDHKEQFTTLSKEIKENITPHCVTLQGQDCQNLKHLIENMINGFINNEEDLINFSDVDQESAYIKKAQCTFSVLQAWYENLYSNNSLLNYSGVNSPKSQKSLANRKVLVVIIPDLENCNEAVLQDFILIIHSYLNVLPFFLIFGVATSLNALHKALPYHVSSKTNIKVFSSQPSTVYLNNVLENVFFTDHCAFSLGGMVFSLFTDLFLFYDLSVTEFIKNYKYSMMEHFSQGNFTALCCYNHNIHDILDQFTHEDFESIRRLYSFRDLVEKESSFKKRVELLTNDDYLKKVVQVKVSMLQEYKHFLHIFLRCLYILVKDLPKTPLGRQIRELYATVTSKTISDCPHFKECFQLLNFLSKENLCLKLKNIIATIENNLFVDENDSKLTEVNEKLKNFLKKLNF
ncbi:hypothetical protein WA026_001023 [Henosepilachna vigintioctopunctata]|uniref:Origin recognition complex subunit 3 n=1 Tax=Henosepilachna vigintioctopunctata TaxID=420089 RepID=A0AAW1V9V0_9CUCU